MKLSPVRVAIGAMGVLLVAVCVAYLVGYGGEASHEIDGLYETPPERATRVLFVGNSHTYRHDVPGQLQRIADTTGEPFWVEQHVAGGASLDQHWRSTELRETIQRGQWDFVVLQGQSLRPALDPDGYLRIVERFSEFGRKFDAEPVIYATWPRARWSDFYAQGSPFADPAQLGDALNRTFRDAQTQNDAILAPVGTAWMAFRRQNPAVPLHADDGNHATPAGAYLAAAVLYRAMSVESLEATDYVPAGLDAALVEQLQRAATGSLDRWRTDWEAAESATPSRPASSPAKTSDAGRSDSAVINP